MLFFFKEVQEVDVEHHVIWYDPWQQSAFHTQYLFLKDKFQNRVVNSQGRFAHQQSPVLWYTCGSHTICFHVSIMLYNTLHPLLRLP